MATSIGNWEMVIGLLLERVKTSNDLDAFRRLPNDVARIQYLQSKIDLNEFDWIKKYFEQCQDLYKKSVDRATADRMAGNKLFQKKQYRAAVDSYTEAILQGPFNSEELSLAFGNRSATWFHLGEFKNSLEDISEAIRNGYPVTTQHKLEIRCAHCHFQLGNFTKALEALQKFSEDLMKDVTLTEKRRKELKRDAEDLRTKIFQASSTVEPPLKEDSSVPVVSYGNNPVLVQASAAVNLMCNERQGRFLVANQDIKPGDTLIVERPYAAILLPDYYSGHCHHCFTRLHGVFPCRCCTAVKYCSPSCEEKAWTSFHYIECNYLDLLHSIGIAHLSLRIVLVAGLPFLLVYLKDFRQIIKKTGKIPGLTESGHYERNYLTVYDLMTHSEDMNTEDLYQYSVTAVLLLQILQHSKWFDQLMASEFGIHKCDISSLALENKTDSCMNDDICQYNEERKHLDIILKKEKPNKMIHREDHYIDEKLSGNGDTSQKVLSQTKNFSDFECSSNLNDTEIYIGGLLLRHIQQLICNAHAITEVQAKQTSKETLIEETSQVRVATAIYPTASLMNHSCDPTIISSFSKDILVVRAVKQVKAGEEIFNCYGPHHKRMKKNERQKSLQDQYFFTCSCLPCTSAFEEDLIYTSYSCPRCCGPFCEEEGRLKCKGCQHTEDSFSKFEMDSQEANDLFSRGLTQLKNENFADATRMMTLCYRMRKKLLYKHNFVLAETQDCLARCYAMAGQFMKASKFLEKSIETVKLIYGPESIEIANELHKLSEILISAHEWKHALEVTNDAISLFTLHYGRFHDSVKKLTNAKKELIDLL